MICCSAEMFFAERKEWKVVDSEVMTVLGWTQVTKRTVSQENDVSVKMCTVLLLTMVQVLYLLQVFILAHYGPPSTETPTTETTTVRCHKNSWIYLTSTSYWWLLRPTITIRFHSKFQIIAQLFDLIRFKMKNNIRLALTLHTSVNGSLERYGQCRYQCF